MAGCALAETGLAPADDATVPGPDASADACAATPESCNERDDDCDGRVDEDFDLATDPNHCGGCGMICPLEPRNGSPSCAGSECVLACDDGFADCNVDIDDGCEASLASGTNCGACGTVCGGATPFCQTRSGGGFECVSNCDAALMRCGDSCVDIVADALHCGGCDVVCAEPPRGSPVCAASTCGLACDAGFDDCNATLDDGCETPLDRVNNCGGCGVRCRRDHAAESCPGQMCMIGACDMGWGDCNTDPDDGCERDIRTLTDCGGCGTACTVDRGTPSCSTGTCGVSDCDAGFEDCNGVAGDGCETRTGTLSDCSGCGDACSFPNGVAACNSRSCELVDCMPGFGNCDMNDGNGCETVLGTLSNCMSCGDVCSFPNAGATCGGGGCAIGPCDTGFGNCAGGAASGCEQRLDTLVHCGGCRTACTRQNATATCAGGTCAIDSCDGTHLSCDATDSSGCETNITTSADCGGCGTSCTGLMSACTAGACACPGSCDCLNAACGTGGSACACGSGCGCDFTCTGDCAVDCDASSCILVARGIDTLSPMTCRGGADCTVDARDATTVEVSCAGSGTVCDIDCDGATTCTDIDCTSGAECILDCTDAGSCDFGICNGGSTDCGGNITVCNRSCP